MPTVYFFLARIITIELNSVYGILSNVTPKIESPHNKYGHENKAEKNENKTLVNRIASNVCICCDLNAPKNRINFFKKMEKIQCVRIYA